jgi:hypothetical protein
LADEEALRAVEAEVAAQPGNAAADEGAAGLVEGDRIAADAKEKRERAAVLAEEDRIAAEAKEKRERATREHAGNIERARCRIEAARRQRDDTAAKYAAEEAAATAKVREELQRRLDENARTDTAALAGARAKSDELSATIAALAKQAGDAGVRVAEPTPRQSDQRRIDTLTAKIQSLDEIIGATFEAFYDTIRQPAMISRGVQPSPPTESESSRPSSARSGRNPNNSVSRGSRREANRVVTPIEPKMRRRPQIVITPQ